MRLHRPCFVAVFLALCALDVIFAAKTPSAARTRSSYRGVDEDHVSGVEMLSTKSLFTLLSIELILAISSFLMNISETPSMMANKRRAIWILFNCAFVHNNFPVDIFRGKFQFRECLCFWQVAPDILTYIKPGEIKLPEYSMLLGDIGHRLALIESRNDAHIGPLICILGDLKIPFAERSQMAYREFKPGHVDRLERVDESLLKIILRFINDPNFGESVYQVAMAQQGSCQANILGHLMAFSAPIDYFSKLGTILDRSAALNGFLMAPVVPYSDEKRREIHDRNKNLINSYFADNRKGFMEDINSIRFADLDMVSSVELFSDLHDWRASYYALVYSCHWDKPELFAAWSKLLSTVPSISELEHELIFEKQSLSGYENCVDSPIVSDILASFYRVPRLVLNCPNEAFLSLWYSVLKLGAINNRSDGKFIHILFSLAFSFAKTAADKELFAAMIVKTWPRKQIHELPYDPILIKHVLSDHEVDRQTVLTYFAYSVMYNIPELTVLIFQKYGETAAERRRFCKDALELGLIPPAFRNALSEDLSISHYLGDLLSSIVPSSTEQACVIS